MAVPMIQRARLLDRFLQYVKIGTTADPNTQDYPSSRGQWLLGQLLVEQLQELGISDALQDEHGLVWATVPATIDGPTPTLLFNAHLDTSPEAPGDRCKPQVIDRYEGGDILLLSGDAIVAEETPELSKLIGHTLVTTDGKTLLGGDDKAGVAAIMEMAHTWIENPHVPHGPIRLLFTCDEEIGRGTRHLDLELVHATAGYTLDGGGEGTIDVETFSADMATVRFTGINTHPSVGKGKMVNAIRAAGKFLSMLPSAERSPETTADREGFLHPYVLQGSVSEATVQILLRDFETAKLSEFASEIRSLAEDVCRSMPRLKADITVEEQYRNMADGLKRFPMAVELAEKAFAQLGVPCERSSIRGGTDGALMTQMGLPTPNLSVGQYNIHSTKEFVSLDQMEIAVAHGIALADLWQQHGRS
jgi:tripeptide aminopeptidase